jgi:hypothetical protein
MDFGNDVRHSAGALGTRPLAGQSELVKFDLHGPGLNTFIFGFKGVGGVPLPNPDPIIDEPTGSSPTTSTAVPEPFTIVGTPIGGTSALRMRKKLKSND